MTQLLEKAFAEATQLPEEEQDSLGAWILAELESERRWDEAFARGSREQFEAVLAKVPDVEPEEHDKLPAPPSR